MCGIFAYFSKYSLKDKSSDSKLECIKQNANKISHRGPDLTTVNLCNNDNICLIFHRLAINDLSPKGNQPLTLNDNKYILICNGEIYNWKELADKYDIITQSTSDCEIILHMYKKFGIERTLSEIQGYFAFVLLDLEKLVFYACSDYLGIRSLFYGYNDSTGEYGISSELKAITCIFENVKHFPPGFIWTGPINEDNIHSINNNFTKYYTNLDNMTTEIYNYNNALELIRTKFDLAIKRRLLSDRPIGCLLSGGIDSSLVCDRLSRHFPPYTLKTFSIGLKDSPDLVAAKKVAEVLQTDHYEVIVTEDDLINQYKTIVQVTESTDTTTN